MTPNDGHIEIGTLFESARLQSELDKASAAHLEACRLCRTRMSWMTTAADLGPRELEYEPPQSLLNDVVRLGRNTGLLKQLHNWITASLTFDSFSAPAVAGVRATESAARQMTFETADAVVAVSLQRVGEEECAITGQVLNKADEPIEDPAARIDLILDGEHLATTPLNSWGEFIFPKLPLTRYGLEVYLADRVISVPALPAVNP